MKGIYEKRCDRAGAANIKVGNAEVANLGKVFSNGINQKAEYKKVEDGLTVDQIKKSLYTEDLELKVDIISRNWENFIQVSLEKIVYNHEYDAWEYTEEYLITIEVRIEDYYKNNDEVRTQEKLEDFLNRLPEPVELALI